MTPKQTLLDYLRKQDEMYQRAQFPRKYNPASFLLTFGRFFTPRELPKGSKRGDANYCFYNAQIALIHDADLLYVEGYGLVEVDHPVHHGWCIDKRQRALEFTWEKPGRCYFGVCLRSEKMMAMLLKYNESVCVLDDWRHNWPALDDESWLHPVIHRRARKRPVE